MLGTIKSLLKEYAIEYCKPIPLSECIIKRPYLLESNGLDDSCTAVMFLIPYYTTFCESPSRNISAYAVSKDYHGFCRMLSESIVPKLKETFPEYNFALFSDHSPIDEPNAAAKSGLGVMGKNHLLLTEPYSSYVFLAEIITNAPIESAGIHEVKGCVDCGKCYSACPPLPNSEFCMSALTQKKGKLSGEEENAIRSFGIAWGCDACQECCPYTEKAKKNGTIYSKIEYFNTDCTPHLTAELISEMSDAEFAARAYSWRKRETILRNLRILEPGKE